MKHLTKLNQIEKVVSQDTKTPVLKVGSAFTGIGAFELAMTNICPFSSEFICEWDSKANESFLANFSTKKKFLDITRINLDEVPSIDIYCCTPPCVDFSTANSVQKGFKSQSGRLVFEAIKIIEKTRPRYVIYENIKNLVGKKFKKSFNIILKELNKLGYQTTWKVLNSKDFGVPQNRERVFIVGIRNDIDQSFEFPTPNTPTPNINDIMVPGTDYTPYIYHESNLKKFPTKRETDIIKLFKIPRLARHQGDSTIYSTDGISPTLRTGNRDHFYDTKNNLFRRLTLAELTALQGFPSDFKWPVGKTAQRKQLGNSVSVPIFDSILRELLKDYLPKNPTIANNVPASITNTSAPVHTASKTKATKSTNSTCISLLQTIKQKEGYISGPIINTGIKAIRKVATDRTTEIIKENIDRPLLSKNMYINQALINYSKDQDIFDSIEAMDTKKLTKYLKDRDLNLYNYDSFADDSDTKKFTLFPYAGGKQGVNKSKMQTLVGNAFKNKKYTKFIDAFAGGLGAVYNVLPTLLKNGVEEIVVNDINKSIINVYRQVQKRPKQVQRQLASIALDYYKKFGKFSPETREEARELHNKLEKEFKQLEITRTMSPRRAALFLFLMHKSTGGMLDYDMKTKTCFFETSYKIINIDLLINKVQLFHKILTSTKFKFKSVKYQTILKACNDTDLVLLDPPYLEFQASQATTKGCSFTYGITDFNHKELLNKCKNLKSDWIYYNNNNPLIEQFSKKHNYSYSKNNRTYSNGVMVGMNKSSTEICMTKFTSVNKSINYTAANNPMNIGKVA